jgi:hypothetical protein
VSVEEGNIGICVWFGAPIMQNMSGHKLAWHWHAICEHVHLQSHFGIVCSDGSLLRYMNIPLIHPT